jgi:hypothetical protein
MNKLNLTRPSNRELERFIEPLANYICAADRPKEALLSVLAVLRDEVQATNRAAVAHFGGLRTQSFELAF